MREALLAAVPAAPLLLAALVASRPTAAPVALRLAPAAAALSLAAVLFVQPGTQLQVPWVLLDTRLGLDVTGRTLLLLTGLLWTAAAVYALAYHHDDPRGRQAFAFLLLAMAGNLGLVIAQDVASFYAFFALMTFSSYGLVVHERTDFAFRAGLVYLALAVMGEFVLLVGILLAVQASGTLALADVPAALAASEQRSWAVLVLLLGFGIKAGLVPLHVWLPLAHPAAPTPASAVLSGAMIKAGLLGWLRFLPLGEAEMASTGVTVLLLGLVGAFGAVAAGLTQTDTKTALAYSSVSQMGLITVAVGVALMQPQAWPVAQAAVLVYALHHGLAKGSLFLGAGLARSRPRQGPERALLAAGLAAPALALVGVPLSSGFVAKGALKEAAALAPGAWPQWLALLLPLAAAGTGLLMARYLYLAWREATGGPPQAHGARAGMWVAWAALVAVSAVLVWPAPAALDLAVATGALFKLDTLRTASWPALLAAGGALLAARLAAGGRLARVPAVPAGDALLPVEGLIALTLRASRSATRLWRRSGAIITVRLLAAATLFGDTALAAASDRRLARWNVAGTALLVVALTLGLLLQEGR